MPSVAKPGEVGKPANSLGPQTKIRKTTIGLYLPINDARACNKLHAALTHMLE
jgi:hypothetical protein